MGRGSGNTAFLLNGTEIFRVCLLAFLTSCARETSIYLTLDADVPVDQYAITIGETALHYPDAPANPLPSPVSVRLLLTQTGNVTVSVDAFLAGQAVGTTTASVTVTKGAEAALSARIGSPMMSGGCNATSCAAGCCDDASCVARTALKCGTGGNTCTRCDMTSANTCGVDGLCHCGAGEPCSAGKRCRSGVCICDGASCPGGCCDGEGSCRAGTSEGACGVAGGLCEGCLDAEGHSSACTNGVCAGCTNACPDGCCSGATCNTPSMGSCGASGKACVACDLQKSDGCVGGACACGTGVPCQEGQLCSGGVCVCDGDSCEGCCTATVNGQCLPGTDQAQCGGGGNLCSPCSTPCAGGICNDCSLSTCSTGCCAGSSCVANMPFNGMCGAAAQQCVSCGTDRADKCVDGACACGSFPQCGAGQECKGGKCQCSQGSCDGCCDGDVCTPVQFPVCEEHKGKCEQCDPARANNCGSDGCRCGSKAQCPMDKTCEWVLLALSYQCQ